MPGGLSGTKVGGGQAKTSSLESLVRAAEKDDLLLYLTAICGIFMPGIVYILYHYLHKMYENYSKKREEERLIEERERSAVTVFFASDNDEAQRLAHLVSERLAHESPPVIDLAYVDIEDFSNFKGIGIFLISSGKKGREPESVEWFFDWLEELGSDNKRSKKHRRFFECRKMHFAIFGIDNFMLRGRSNTRFNRLLKRWQDDCVRLVRNRFVVYIWPIVIDSMKVSNSRQTHGLTDCWRRLTSSHFRKRNKNLQCDSLVLERQLNGHRQLIRTIRPKVAMKLNPNISREVLNLITDVGNLSTVSKQKRSDRNQMKEKKAMTVQNTTTPSAFTRNRPNGLLLKNSLMQI